MQRLQRRRRRQVCLFGTSANPPTGYGGHLGLVLHLATATAAAGSGSGSGCGENSWNEEDSLNPDGRTTIMREEDGGGGGIKGRASSSYFALLFDEVRIIPVYQHMYSSKRKRNTAGGVGGGGAEQERGVGTNSDVTGRIREGGGGGGGKGQQQQDPGPSCGSGGGSGGGIDGGSYGHRLQMCRLLLEDATGASVASSPSAVTQRGVRGDERDKARGTRRRGPMAKMSVSDVERRCFELKVRQLQQQQQQPLPRGEEEEEEERRHNTATIRVGTADVLEMLASDEPDVDFTWAMGSDTFVDFADGKWKRTDDIRRAVRGRFLVFVRRSCVPVACGEGGGDANGSNDGSKESRRGREEEEEKASSVAPAEAEAEAAQVVREKVRQFNADWHRRRRRGDWKEEEGDGDTMGQVCNDDRGEEIVEGNDSPATAGTDNDGGPTTDDNDEGDGDDDGTCGPALCVVVPTLTSVSSTLARTTKDETLLSSHLSPSVLRYVKEHQLYAFASSSTI